MSGASGAAGAPPPRPLAEPGLSPRWIAALVLVPVAMLLFALFAFKPLYQLWCRATGTALRPNDPALVALGGTATGRHLQVFFEANVADGLPVSFAAAESSQRVEVGMDARNVYRFRNLADRPVRFRPVHYVSPNDAAMNFGMKVCFCFTDMVLQPGESVEHPVVYRFGPELDARIDTATVCYDLFALRDGEGEAELTRRIDEAVRGKGGMVSPRRAPEPQPAQPGAAP